MQELRVVPRVGEEPRRRSTTGDRSEGTRTPNQLPLPASSSRTQRESERRSPPGGGAWEGAGGNSRPGSGQYFHQGGHHLGVDRRFIDLRMGHVI